MPQDFDLSFLPTKGRRQQQLKLDVYAQLYVNYINVIQQQGDAMRHDMQKMEAAYHQVASDFAYEQSNFAHNRSGPSYVLADLNEYARRCDLPPQNFKE
jgi:hypothetical protein